MVQTTTQIVVNEGAAAVVEVVGEGQTLMANFAREWRFAARLLLRSPGFTVVAVLTLGLAIGACTTIYSLVYGVALQPLPYPSPDQLVQLRQVNRAGGRGPFSDPNFEDLRDRSRGFQAIAEYAGNTRSVVAGTLPLRAGVVAVSREFFDVFKTPPAVGRGFTVDELNEGAAPVAVISHGFWHQHFNAAVDVASLTVRVDGTPHTVVGVLPPTFAFPAGTDIWTPREQRARNPYRTGHNWPVVARLGADVTLGSARADATTVAQQLERELGDATFMTDVEIIPLHEEMVGRVRPILWVLLASVALLLIVACANLTNLMLVRVSGRGRELAVRSALGASLRALALPFVAESLLLALIGGALGVAITHTGIRALAAAETSSLPRLAEVRLSWPVLLFALGVTSLTALALGISSAWRARRPDIAESLKQAQRGQAGHASAGRVRNVLVVAQLAVSVVLLVGAGLLTRSLVLLLRQDPGFRTTGALTVDLSSPRLAARPTPRGLELPDASSLARQAQLHERLLESMKALPGVVEAGGINSFPMGRNYSNGLFLIVRGDEEPSIAAFEKLRNDTTRTGEAHFRVASTGYFRAMGIPLVRGRLFEATDTINAPHAAVISESLASKRWPNEDPIGLRIQFGGMDGDLRIFTIVGIVGDIRELGFDSEPRPTFYADYRQRPLMTSDFTLVLQTSVDPASLVTRAREIITDAAPEVPPRFRTIDQVVTSSVAGRQFTLLLTSLFAGGALLLAVLGVYGVLSYAVAQRNQEFGVRMAIGARPADLGRMVLAEAGRLVAVGLVLGTIVALLVGRFLDSLLFGIRSTDPLTYVIVASVLGLSALIACQIPAIRASRVDPLRALRAE